MVCPAVLSLLNKPAFDLYSRIRSCHYITNMTLKQIAQRMASLILHLSFQVFWTFYSVLTWPTRKLTTSIISLVDYLFSKTKSTIQKLLFLWSIFVMLVLVSLLLYAGFYSAYVPAAEISRSVHLSFSVCPTGVGVCSFPSANVTFWNDEAKVQEFLGSGQTYSVKLELVMPESRRNRDMGMFMVVVKMYDGDGHISGTSQRSVGMSEATVFQYRSIFMRILDMVLLKPLCFMGILEPKKTLTVELFTHFVDDYYHPSVGASVEVQSHAIEIYSATLKLLAKFTGLKYFLYNWPLISTVIAFWFNLFILATGVGTVLYLRSEMAQKMEDQLKNNGISEKHADNSHQTSNQSSVGVQKTKINANGGDSDVHNLPLVQEPADFVKPDDNKLFTELKHRIIN